MAKHNLIDAIEASNADKASRLFGQELNRGEDPRKIHDSLFPVVQRVLNPPFINPHLPKMYRICRELFRYLKKDEIPDLVHLEVKEYARRNKLKGIAKTTLPSCVSFGDIESAIRDQDSESTAVLLAAFSALKGQNELARRLLLIGSEYLDDTLGHSVSCTAFILLEMIGRSDQDPWPALVTLADYFCKGRFSKTPALRTKKTPSPGAMGDDLLRAASGRGIVNLHHTITIYAIERARRFFTTQEYAHMVASWIDFIGDKKAETFSRDYSGTEKLDSYKQFYQVFSRLEAKPVVACLAEMLGEESRRRQLGRFLIRGLCDLYQEDYNPHYLTGLGSALWAVDQHWRNGPFAITALYQHVDYIFKHLI